jgi:MFS transporter, PAT family, beta-lactamase induction signal transducer AmpG
VTLLAPEPQAPARPAHRDYAQIVKEAVIDPFLDFMKHSGWLLILAFTLFYKFGDALGGTMANPFYNEMGFTGTEIAAVSKLWGVWMTVLGAVVGGIVVARWGMFPALMIGGILQALTNFAFTYVAIVGHDLPALAVAITMDNVAGGAAGAALVAYLSSLCNVAYTATQYALLTSFMAYGRTVLSSWSGWLADHTDWATFWSATALLAVPGLLLLAIMWRYFPYKPASHADKQIAAFD